MPAPSGKDAGSKVWLCHIEIRGRRLAVIGARGFGCNVCGRPTSALVRPPWESEDAAFAFLLRAVVVCAAIALLAVALKALF